MNYAPKPVHHQQSKNDNPQLQDYKPVHTHQAFQSQNREQQMSYRQGYRLHRPQRDLLQQSSPDL